MEAVRFSVQLSKPEMNCWLAASRPSIVWQVPAVPQGMGL